MYSDSDLPLCNSNPFICCRKEKFDIHNFLAFDGRKCFDYNEAMHQWDEDEERVVMCNVHYSLRNEVPRTGDVWMVYSQTDI